MATISKLANNTALNLIGSWSGAIPGTGDIGYWNLGATGTATNAASTGINYSIGAIELAAAQSGLVDILRSAAGNTITLAGTTVGSVTAGVYLPGAANKIRFQVPVIVNTTQDWALPNAGAYVELSSFGLLQGNGTINKTGPGTIYTYTNSTFTGTINLTEGIIAAGTGVIQSLTTSAGTINVNAAVGTTAGFAINGAAASATFPATININSDASFQYLGNTGTLTMSGSMALGASTRTLTVNGTTAFSGPITGTAGFTKTGAGTLTLSAANPLLSGDVSVTASTLATAINVNALQAATLNWTGTVGTFSPLTNSNIGAIKGSTTTNTLALGASAINVGGANTSETFSGKFTGSGLITKNGTGTWTLDGDNSGQTGGFTVGTSGSGTLVAGSATALGSASAGGVSVVSGSTLQVNAAISKASATLTLAGTGIGGNGALRSLSGTTSYTASGYTITSDVNIGVDAGTMTLGGAGAVMGTGGINKVGAGELVLLGESNTLDRQIVISAGTLTVKKLAPAGTVSSLGRGNTTPAIALTGTLKFDGAGTDSTNRSITFTGAAPVLEATGSGAITYSASTTSAMTGGRLITLTGTSTSANALTSGLADGTGAVSLAKTGAGTWNVTGTLSHTGGTTLSLGTLGALGSTATFAANLNISGGELANGTFTAPVVMTGGTVTATLASTSTLTVNSGSASTLQPATNANTFSGATTVAAGGILRLITGANPTTAGAGRVLGTSAVSVSGDIKTGATGAQRGQMRYGGNLTFNTGAKLYVGGA